jgi:hypothetical protein
LGLSPELNLCKGRDQVRSVHEVQIGRVYVCYSIDGNDIVVDRL